MNVVNRFCYRAQSFATTRAVASRLDLEEHGYSTTFQSRLAGQKWIGPYTDVLLTELAQAGVKRLAVLTPSFTADCLETLEEIGIRGREQWQELGGEDFLLVPCLNASPEWADAVTEMVRAAS
jgi:ferrochelatase